MITPSFGLTATERVLPSLALDWTTGLAQTGVDVVRAGVATFVGSNGLIQSASADTQRIDYSTGTAGLLVEESRINAITYSEQFNNGSWNKLKLNTTGTPAWVDVAVAPDGNLTADKLIEDATSGTHAVYKSVGVSASTRTMSVFAKAGERTSLCLNNDASGMSSFFNLSTGVVSFQGANAVAKITPANDGWYRCSITGVFTGNFYIVTAIGNSQSYLGDGTSGLFVYGAQVETGAFPTSYIPTEGSAVTRNADVATMTGTNFSDWFNASEGTFVFEGLQFTTATSRVILDATNGTTSERIQIYSASSGIPTIYIADGGVGQAQVGSASISVNTTYKASAAYKLNDIGISRNGNIPATDNTATIPTLDRTTLFCRYDSTLQLNGYARKLLFYPQRLLNAELQSTSNL